MEISTEKLKIEEFDDIQGFNNNIFVIDENNNKQKLCKKIPNLIIRILGDNNQIILGENLIINGSVNININGNNININIGNNVKVNKNIYFSFFPEVGSVPDGSTLAIGDDCLFNGECITFGFGEANTHIKIGKDCLFAGGIKFVTSDDHTIYDINTKKRLNNPGDIIIGNHCWICADVTVLNNTEISDNSVIGTKSVVTKKFLEPNLMLAGVPAKVRKENINWDWRIDNQKYL